MTLIDRVFLISVPKISIISEQIKADYRLWGTPAAGFLFAEVNI